MNMIKPNGIIVAHTDCQPRRCTLNVPILGDFKNSSLDFYTHNTSGEKGPKLAAGLLGQDAVYHPKHYVEEELVEQNWNEVWESSFKSVAVGQSVVVKAPFHEIKEPYKLIPKTGVYIIKTHIITVLYTGIMNIGFNPTVLGKHQTIEAHLFDFNVDL